MERTNNEVILAFSIIESACPSKGGLHNDYKSRESIFAAFAHSIVSLRSSTLLYTFFCRYTCLSVLYQTIHLSIHNVARLAACLRLLSSLPSPHPRSKPSRYLRCQHSGRKQESRNRHLESHHWLRDCHCRLGAK